MPAADAVTGRRRNANRTSRAFGLYGRLGDPAFRGERWRHRAYTALLRAITPVLRGVVWAKGNGLGDAVCADVLHEVLLAVHLKRYSWQTGAPVRPLL